MEPWDGPASIAFTDGMRDRRGARPQRPAALALLRHQGRPGRHGLRGRRARHPARATCCTRAGLQPGRMFLVDTEQGRIIADEEIKQQHRQRAALPRSGCDEQPGRPGRTCPSRRERPRAATIDTLLAAPAGLRLHLRGPASILMAPMARDGDEPVGSMGTDTPLAVLSDKPQLLYNYFKQLFAQVTNPPIDAIREELVTSTDTTIGPEATCSSRRRQRCRLIKLPITHPDQRGAGQAALTSTGSPGFRVDDAADPLPRRTRAAPAWKRALDELCAAAPTRPSPRAQHPDPLRPRRGHASTRRSRRCWPSPALHHHLIREGTRTQVRPGARDRRAARGAPLRAADRLRRRRDQPLPGLRDASTT